MAHVLLLFAFFHLQVHLLHFQELINPCWYGFLMHENNNWILQRTQLVEWASTLFSKFYILTIVNQYGFCTKPFIPRAIFRLRCIINNDKYLLLNASHQHQFVSLVQNQLGPPNGAWSIRCRHHSFVPLRLWR